MFKVGEIVKYAPGWYNDGEQYYIHMVKEVNPDTKMVLIDTLNTTLMLGSSERVHEDMIQKAKKYEVILNRSVIGRKFIITNTEDRKFFAGYDAMGSVNWVDSDLEATGLDLEEAEQIVRDLESADM